MCTSTRAQQRWREAHAASNPLPDPPTWVHVAVRLVQVQVDPLDRLGLSPRQRGNGNLLPATFPHGRLRSSQWPQSIGVG